MSGADDVQPVTGTTGTTFVGGMLEVKSPDTVEELAPELGAAVGREQAQHVADAARRALAGGSAPAEPGGKTSEYGLARLALLLGVVAAGFGVWQEDDKLRDGGLTMATAVTTVYIGGRSLRKGMAGLVSPKTPDPPA